MKKRGLGTRAWGLANVLGLSITWMNGSVGFADEPARADDAEEMRITVRVYNYAEVPGGILAEAESQAARIFRKAGVHTVWVDCPLAEDESEPACSARPGPTDLILRVIRRSMAPRAAFGQSTSGFAVQSADGQPGSLAAVFYDRVERVAKQARLSRAMILGHTAAHEIGHLLLGTNSHSTRGLMCADLQRKDLKLASLGKLLFTPEQAARLRADVRERSGLADVRPAGGISGVCRGKEQAWARVNAPLAMRYRRATRTMWRPKGCLYTAS